MARKVADLVDEFLDWARDALKATTVNAYEHQLKHWCRSAGKIKLGALTAQHLTRWAHSWHQVQAVKRCLNWCVTDAELIESNPFKDVKMPPRNVRRRILLPKEMQRFVRAASPAGRLFLLGMRETMARPQEIREADLDDLRSEDPHLSIDEALEQGKALIVLRDFKDRRRRRQSERPRVILVNARLGRTIARIRRARGAAGGKLFVNTLGRPWSNNAVRCLLRRLRRRLDVESDKHGENIVAYTFRHSTATYAASKGVVDRVLAEILGHTETRTTARYQHLQVSHLREALSRLEPAVKRKANV